MGQFQSSHALEDSAEYLGVGRITGGHANRPFTRVLQVFNIIVTFLALAPFLIRVRPLLGDESPDRVIDLLCDDAYYYLTVASNIVESGRSTFDGITSTNGYQPLWLWCIVALAELVGVDSWRLFVATCLVTYGLALTPLFVGAYLDLKRRIGLEASALLAGLTVMLLTSDQQIFLGGMETILFIPIAVPLVLAIERGKDWAAGALISVAVFVRLDSLVLVPAFCMVAWLRSRQRGETGRAWGLKCVRACAPPCALFGLYLLGNWLAFGTALPVSGLAKALDGPRLHNWGSAARHVVELKQIFPFAFALGLLEWGVRKRSIAVSTFALDSLCVFAAGCVLQFLYYGAFSTWPLWPWYSYCYCLVLLTIVCRVVLLAGALWGAGYSAISGATMLGVLAFALRGTASLVGSAPLSSMTALPPTRVGERAIETRALTFNQASLLQARALFANAEHTLIAMGDRAGGLAYWARPSISVVQLEGLLGDIDFIRARAQSRGESYVSRFPIKYFVVDREFLPTNSDSTRGKVYVVVDPIQARVATKLAPTFCFPETALVWQLSYGSSGQRFVFSFADRIPCSEADSTLVKRIADDKGLRQFSLPAEYSYSRLTKPLEDFDRLALRH